jgi:hypothetical protein
MPRYRYSNVLNPKTMNAHKEWYSMKPTERIQLMKNIGSKKKTDTGVFRDIIKHLEKKY